MKNLLLVKLGALRYGVWEDDVPSLRDGQTLHRLPLSPACIAGMAIVDDRSITLIDLSVCLGLPAVSRSRKGHFLLVSPQEKIAGFVVEGGIGRLAVSPEQVRPLPSFLRTPAVDSAVVRGNEAVPVVNIGEVFTRIKRGAFDPLTASFLIPQTEPASIDTVSNVRLFEAGGSAFAAPATEAGEPAVQPERITRIPLAPAFVAGMVVHDGRILPVIHLARRMKLPDPGTAATMLVAEIAGDQYGFLVDREQGTFSPPDGAMKPHPPLTRCPWMRAAVRKQGAIIPLIHFGALLATAEGAADDPPLPDRYGPTSTFPERFGREDADIVEFSLLGARHALPKEELQDTLPLLPYRPVPNVQPIVIGLADHDSELLPVIDLAMIFGRRSLVTQDWRMILVRNGDFRGLVITEALYGDRRLPVDMQRAVPILLPHRVVYGCYPDAGTVKLILNVEALTVYFEKALVRELLSAISKEMAQAPAELVHELLEREAPSEEAEVALPAGDEAVAGVTAAAAATAEELLRAVQAEEETLTAGEARGGADEEAQRRVEEEAREEEKLGEHARSDEEERVRAEAEARAREEESGARAEEDARTRAEEEERARLEAEATARAAEEARRKAEEERARLEEEVRARAEQDAREQAEAEEEARRKAEDVARLKAEEARLREEAENKARAEAEAMALAAEEARRRAEETERTKLEAEATARAEEESRRKAEEERARAEAEARARAEAEAMALAAEEARRRAEETERTRLEAEATARAEEQSRRKAEEERAWLEAEAKAEAQAEEEAREKARAEEQARRAEEQARAKAEAEAREQDEARREPEETRAREAADVARTAEEIARGAAARTAAQRAFDARSVLSQLPPAHAARTKREPTEEQPSVWKKILVAGVAILLLVLLYVAGVGRRPAPLVKPEKRQEEPAVAPAVRKEKRQEEPVVAEKAALEARERLVLSVPAAGPAPDVTLYVVKTGDTLWAISKRFTGNPFNYPRLAKTNKIANPDLIFPNQKIRIVQEGKP